MASHESAKKSIRKSARQRAVNQSRISRVRTFIKKLEKIISAADTRDAISSSFSQMQKEVMRGVAKRVLHKNTAARKISQLHQKVKTALGEANQNS
ncbi:MAG: 30S ribosomal protein S20 [Holosporales bacterium]|jgi:small subunit ribosomal protein S20|nr:30S ribosomal protein S20 [Holosporales bacterium]